MIPNTLEGELYRRKCQHDYSEYVKLANPSFYMTKFHKYLCDEIQTFLERPSPEALDILLLSVPPRHGKSFTVTETLPSWFLGKHPDGNVIIASYESTFAESFSRRNRDKFNEYATDVFHVKQNDKVQNIAQWETAAGGRCRAAGLKAGITGHGAELFIIDDPIKNSESADSPTILGKIQDEMGPSVQSRIHPYGKLIVIQTRWVENDVIGWIEQNWSEFIYKNINLPCECEDEKHDPLGRKLGDSLMGPHLGDNNLPPRICNDNNWLRSKKLLVLAGEGERTWNALYQGHPSAQDGNLFKPSWWKLYDRRTMRFEDFDFTCLSVDASFKKTDTSDFVAIGIWGLKANDIYLWKLVNKRMAFVETTEFIKNYVKEFPDLYQLIIEDKANGSAIIDTLQVLEGMPPIQGIDPKGGKYSRAQAVAHVVADGHVHIPIDFTREEEHYIEWDGKDTGLKGHEKFILQHTRFPYMAHDDIVDMTSQALARLLKLLTGEEPMPDTRHIRYVKWYPDTWEDYEQMSPDEQVAFIKQYGAPLEWADY